MKKKLTKDEIKGRGFKYIGRTAWLWTIPGILIYIIFRWYPVLLSFVVSLQKYQILGKSTFVGLLNFNNLISDPLFFIVFRNTLYYTALSLALVFLPPIFVSILLMEMRRSVIAIMMILWFIPVGSIASVVLWKWFYNTQYGLLNGILVSLGLPTSGWLNDARIAMLCLVLPGLIMYGPSLIYIASIQSIPEEMYEAAELEGAGFWQKIWHITLPRLRPIIAMLLILATISNMQMFNQAFIMTGGGPHDATRTVVMYIYRMAFQRFKFGYATALAVVLFFVLFVLIYLQRKYFKENPDI